MCKQNSSLTDASKPGLGAIHLPGSWQQPSSNSSLQMVEGLIPLARLTNISLRTEMYPVSSKEVPPPPWGGQGCPHAENQLFLQDQPCVNWCLAINLCQDQHFLILHHEVSVPKGVKVQGVHQPPYVPPVSPGAHTTPPPPTLWGCCGESAGNPKQISMSMFRFRNSSGTLLPLHVPSTN